MKKKFLSKRKIPLRYFFSIETLTDNIFYPLVEFLTTVDLSELTTQNYQMFFELLKEILSKNKYIIKRHCTRVESLMGILWLTGCRGVMI